MCDEGKDRFFAENGAAGQISLRNTDQESASVTQSGSWDSPVWKKNAHLANISFCSVCAKKIIYIIIIKNPPKFTWYAK